jgi:ribosomal protein L7/L12
MKTFIIDAGLVLIGFLIGRFTAPRERTTTVYKSRAEVPASFGKAGGNPADAEIAASLSAGRKIEAIKLYREAYGTDLKDAKDAVDTLQAQQAKLGD